MAWWLLTTQLLQYPPIFLSPTFVTRWVLEWVMSGYFHLQGPSSLCNWQNASSLLVDDKHSREVALRSEARGSTLLDFLSCLCTEKKKKSQIKLISVNEKEKLIFTCPLKLHNRTDLSTLELMSTWFGSENISPVINSRWPWYEFNSCGSNWLLTPIFAFPSVWSRQRNGNRFRNLTWEFFSTTDDDKLKETKVNSDVNSWRFLLPFRSCFFLYSVFTRQSILNIKKCSSFSVIHDDYHCFVNSEVLPWISL